MNQREISKLESRLSYWKEQLRTQHSTKKADRNERVIAQAKQRISIISQWIDKPTGILTIPKNAEVKEISLKDFKQAASTLMGVKTDKPAAAMIIQDIKTLDLLYDKIKMQNIQIQAPPEVLAHFRNRLKKERPYEL